MQQDNPPASEYAYSQQGQSHPAQAYQDPQFLYPQTQSNSPYYDQVCS